MSTIKHVLVIGASGSVGVPVVQALLENNFIVSALSRLSSTATFPDGVQVFKTDFSEQSLIKAFKGQDAVVSTLAHEHSALETQTAIIDAAIASGVKIFLPSEFGIDTASPNAARALPLVQTKIDVANYLKSKQDKISWTAVITGAFFDWSYQLPAGFLLQDVNIPPRKAIIYDGGNLRFEATNLGQAGKAVAAILRNPELTRNQYVYVNSFTTTQSEIVEAFEKVLGEKIVVTHASLDSLWEEGMANIKKGGNAAWQGSVQVVKAAWHGTGNVNNYSLSPGLWNERLGLKTESLDETVKDVIRKTR